jgi:hypothetical protein
MLFAVSLVRLHGPWYATDMRLIRKLLALPFELIGNLFLIVALLIAGDETAADPALEPREGPRSAIFS